MDPLTPFALSAATQSIKPLARGVGKLGEFAAVLANEVAGTDEVGSEPAETLPPAESAASLRAAVEKQLDQLLAGPLVGATGTLELEITAEGRLRVQGDHPRGAEIEAMLNGDAELRALTADWTALEKSPIQLSWSANNLTQPGNWPYIMG
jgi:hypothetical protein